MYIHSLMFHYKSLSPEQYPDLEVKNHDRDRDREQVFKVVFIEQFFLRPVPISSVCSCNFLYQVTLKYAAAIDLGRLMETVLSSVSEGFSAIQALDVFMRQAPSLRYATKSLVSSCFNFLMRAVWDIYKCHTVMRHEGET